MTGFASGALTRTAPLPLAFFCSTLAEYQHRFKQIFRVGTCNDGKRSAEESRKGDGDDVTRIRAFLVLVPLWRFAFDNLEQVGDDARRTSEDLCAQASKTGVLVSGRNVDHHRAPTDFTSFRQVFYAVRQKCEDIRNLILFLIHGPCFNSG